jgi:hypothetical protein
METDVTFRTQVLLKVVDLSQTRTMRGKSALHSRLWQLKRQALALSHGWLTMISRMSLGLGLRGELI